MKRSSMLLAALAFASIAGSSLISTAATCGSSTGRTASDKFGSCENTTGGGQVRCGDGTDVGPLATIIVANSGGTTGVQGCSEDSQSLPIAGRVGAYNDGSGAHVFIDGGDAKNPGGAGGWQRYDVSDSGVCARRGSGGTYYTNTAGGHGSSNPDAGVNHKVGPGGVGNCQ